MLHHLLCRHDLLPDFSYLEQFIEQRAVVHHRFAKLLGVGLATLVAGRNELRRPITTVRLKLEQIQLVSGVEFTDAGGIGLQGA